MKSLFYTGSDWEHRNDDYNSKRDLEISGKDSTDTL
jgi:hypothetical protein